MYQLRSLIFSYKQVGYNSEQPFFKQLITDSYEFNFNARDIIRIRYEFMQLLERLSNLFLPWKAEEDRKRLEARRAKKRERAHADEEVAKLKENSNVNIAQDPPPSQKSATSSASSLVEVVDSPRADTTNPFVGSAINDQVIETAHPNIPNESESQVLEVEHNFTENPYSAKKNVNEQHVARNDEEDMDTEIVCTEEI